MAVAAAAIGAVPFDRFATSTEPLALILRDIGQPDRGEDPRFIGLDRACRR